MANTTPRAPLNRARRRSFAVKTPAAKMASAMIGSQAPNVFSTR